MIDRRAMLGVGTLATLIPAACTFGVSDEDERLRTDWAAMAHFAEDNARLIAAGIRPDVVFLGDSTTEFWAHATPELFPPGRLARGISGQTTPQILVRMVADVVALKPRLVHIMAGTNDVARNTGPISPAQTCANLRAMTQLARANGIAVILASVPPATRFPWRPAIDPIRPITEINRGIATFARADGIDHVDYGPVLRTPAGGLRADQGNDGVHPNAPGYRAMAGILGPLLRDRGV